jgi:hypothetical protein
MPRPTVTASPTGGSRSGWRTRSLLLLVAGLLVAPGLSACAAPSAMQGGAPAAHPTPIMNGAHTMPPSTPATAEDATLAATRDAAWSARPAYVRADARTESAYQIALHSPQLLQWMPCYCGCGAMGHRSNLDCYFKPTMAGLNDIRFEEHASYCAICVDTTLLAKQMLDQGQSLRAIRDAIDARFGGSVPGTPTELPPA